MIDNFQVVMKSKWKPSFRKYEPASEEEIAEVTKQLAEVANDPNLTIKTRGHWFPTSWDGLAEWLDRPLDEIQKEYVEWKRTEELKELQRKGDSNE